MAALCSIESGSTRTEGGVVSWLRSGRGPSLVLLHGIGSSGQSWHGQLTGLSDRFDVLAWNAPGYGDSSALAPRAPRPEDYANALEYLLVSLGIEHCHLVGHSLGSLIAAKFARLHAQRVMSLTLASCAIGHARHESGERERLLRSRLGDVEALGMAGMAAKRAPRLLGANASAAMHTIVRENMAQLDPGAYAQAAHMLSRGDMLSDLENIGRSLPLQVVYGEDDVITPPDVNKQAASVRGNTKVVCIPDAGHALYIEQADAFNNAIAAFAGSHHG